MSLLNQPEYETEAETNGTASPLAAAVEAAKAAQAVEATVQEAAAQTTAPAVVKPANTAVAAPASKFHMAFADKQEQIPLEAVEQLSLGAYRIKGEQGKCYHDNEDLGERIRLEVVSFNNRWAIGTGSEKQTSEDKERFRVSYDGKTIAGEGVSVDEYVRGLKAEGYEKAKSSPYIDLWGIMTWAEKKGDIPADEQQLVLVQLSQTSAGNWRNFMVSRGMLESRGVPPITEVEVLAQAQVKGSNKYTNFDFRVPSKK